LGKEAGIDVLQRSLPTSPITHSVTIQFYELLNGLRRDLIKIFRFEKMFVYASLKDQTEHMLLF